MSVLAKNFLMLEDTLPVQKSNWSAVGSTLVADALRGSGDLRQVVRLRVHGESMLPTLWPGDVVEITGCSLEDVQSGEIVLALRDGRLFLHRLVATRPDAFVLRGDSMPGPDPLFAGEAFVGRLVRDSRHSSDRGFQRQVMRIVARALGLLFCYSRTSRRLALKLHSRRSAPAHEFQSLGVR
ncbi:MAG: S24/S26 family peptidase [Terriglobales bacterium]